jgi:hypothetical protein
MEFGGVVLGLLGIAFFATAIFQAKKGATGSFMNRMRQVATERDAELSLAEEEAAALVEDGSAEAEQHEVA